MFRSSSKLPWLSGNTRRHFPVREATKDKQLDSQIPHIPSISITYTQYARYVQTQHGITTWLYDSSIYSLGSEERDITNIGLMTQHSELWHSKNFTLVFSKNFVVFEKRPFKIFQKTFLLRNSLSFGKVFVLASNFGVWPFETSSLLVLSQNYFGSLIFFF